MIARRRPVAARAERDHQRQQMLLARVRELGVRQRVRQAATRAARRVRVAIGHGIGQRGVPFAAGGLGRCSADAQIVKAHPRPDDQHALVAQRRQRTADRYMVGRVEIGAQRHLHERNVGVGHGDLHRNEDAMVPTALALLARVRTPAAFSSAAARCATSGAPGASQRKR